MVLALRESGSNANVVRRCKFSTIATNTNTGEPLKVACEHEFEAKVVCMFPVHAEVSFVESLRSVLEYEALFLYLYLEPYTRPSILPLVK
jgi:hypothetical protein